MRILAKWDKEEFSKTFDFINHYIGTYSFMAKNVHELRFDGKKANEEILKFIGNNFKDLKEVNHLFNDSYPDLKQSTMDRLIKYCFMNKVQPYKLRMIFKEFDVFKQIDIPMVFEFGSNAQ
jgi:hypothetical protein